MVLLDSMTSYNGGSITYDTIGNPLSYYNGQRYTMTWSNGRQLDSTNVGGMNLSYSYNADGQRTSKSRSAYYTDEYVYYGTQLSTIIRSSVNGSKSLTFIYDDAGQALSFYFDTNLNDSKPGTEYYYVCNAQGDVLQLRDHTNAPVANYYYDAWGKLLGITDANGNAITAFNSVAVLNPIRYRGYFYDTETGFYYLNSRYYDPEIGRFINADSVISGASGSLQGYNLFEYCNNNPVNKIDSTGDWPKWIKKVVSTVKKVIKDIANATIRANKFIRTTFSATKSAINYVRKAHLKTPMSMVDLGPLFGKVGFSTTKTKQNKEPGLLYSYSNIGNDAIKYGVGANIAGWLGADAGVSSKINAVVSAQVTPWVHGDISVGLDGVGGSVGFDIGDTSYDFEIKGGWGLIALIIAPEMIVAAGQSGAGSPA